MPQRRDESIIRLKMNQGAACAIVMVFVLSFLVRSATADATGNTISVKSKNTPLIDVLNSVAKTSGCSFIVGDEWKNTPISVNFDQLPLDTALKRILVNLNHVVIYDSRNTIRINIYGASAAPQRGGALPERMAAPPPEPEEAQEEAQAPDPEPEPEPETSEETAGTEQKATPDSASPAPEAAETPGVAKSIHDNQP